MTEDQQQDLEQRSLAGEDTRAASELRIRELELGIRELELEFKRLELARKEEAATAVPDRRQRFFGTIPPAVWVAIVGALATASAAVHQGKNSLELAQRKFEGELISDKLFVQNKNDETLRNLAFYKRIGLLPYTDVSGITGIDEFTDAQDKVEVPNRLASSSSGAVIPGWVQIPAEGVGFVTYGPRYKKYGSPQTIDSIRRVAEKLHRTLGLQLSVGNISRNGGGPLAPHRDHQDGIEVDLRPLRKDGQTMPVRYQDDAYSLEYTKRLVELLKEEPGLEAIEFNDTRIPDVDTAPGGDNQLTVRFKPETHGVAAYLAKDTVSKRALPSNIAWGARVSNAFIAKVVDICDRLECDPNHLMAVMAFETGGSFSPNQRNPISSAIGLIQFVPGGLRMLNEDGGSPITIKALAEMDAVEQLDVVERYMRFIIKRYGRFNTLGDLYASVFFPAMIGKPDDFVFADREGSARRYRQNEGLDGNGDGVITRQEVVQEVARMLEQGLRPEMLAVYFPDSSTS